MTDLVCAWCKEPFQRSHNSGPVPKYCSAYHRQRAFMDRHRGESPAFVCQFCGKENIPLSPLPEDAA